MSEEENTTIEKGAIATMLEEKRIKVTPLGIDASGTEQIAIDANNLEQVAKELKRGKKMNLLNFITAVEVKDGYQAIYRLENLGINGDEQVAVMIKVTVPRDNPVLPSLTKVFPTANWQEREAYDMIGIKFDEHPDLTRILNPDDWDGHPLRKDYIGPMDELNQPMAYK
ncbi:MAG: NADH-quinone oxidoreductase subunit C [Candidatus Melainabacteria bacterium]|nr:NADH-quinone oxidoreductase subunit C [Candidatus Melainabacteria bacterium]